MRITSAHLHHYRLPLRTEWTSAAGGFSVREGWLLRLATNDGRYGYGDCAPLTSTGTESTEVARAALHTLANQLIGMPPGAALTRLPKPSENKAPAARCATETALLDLLSQADNLPLSRYLRGKHGNSSVTVNAALGRLAQIEEQHIRNACSEGFRVIKIKVGMQDIGTELSHLQRIARQLPAGTKLRLDANRAWSEADAMRFLDACADLPIDMIEEPLANPQPVLLQRLQANCTVPLALDESLGKLDLQEIFDLLPVRRLVLKPPQLGGLLPTLALARRATAAGFQCIITSSVDSACGVLAAAHLAAALDNDLAHGLATSSWLTADTGAAPIIASGQLALPTSTGLGFTPQCSLLFSPA